MKQIPSIIYMQIKVLNFTGLMFYFNDELIIVKINELTNEIY